MKFEDGLIAGLYALATTGILGVLGSHVNLKVKIARHDVRIDSERDRTEALARVELDHHIDTQNKLVEIEKRSLEERREMNTTLRGIHERLNKLSGVP